MKLLTQKKRKYYITLLFYFVEGVPHGWDLFYIFGVPMVGHHIHNYTERDRDVSKATMTLFSSYVKHGYLFAIMPIDKTYAN